MENDQLRLFNTSLIEPLTSMSNDELWNFILENEEKVKNFSEAEVRPKTVLLHFYKQGSERFEEIFRRSLEDEYEDLIHTLVLDFCFEGAIVKLDYWARCGYLDDADSCDPKTSDEILPPVDEDSEAAYWSVYFHLLEPEQIENIINAMETNFDKLTDNTREDIDKIKEMHKICIENENYKVGYIYDI